MCLQQYLVEKFRSWAPPEPEVVHRTKRDITLRWDSLQPFHFLAGSLIFKIEKYNKMPQWIVVYSGGKTTKTIDNLAPRHPHKFRLKVILKAEAVPYLAERAIEFYGGEEAVYENFAAFAKPMQSIETGGNIRPADGSGDSLATSNGPDSNTKAHDEEKLISNKVINHKPIIDTEKTCGGDRNENSARLPEKRKWLESQWSAETWTSTDTDGTSAVCFSMAVRCGYIKQVQSMLDERPDLVGAINSQNGFTPLATAVRRGDMNMARYLVSMGADVNQPSSAGQTPLHLAVYAAHAPMAELLIDKGADLHARDWNGLGVEHYAVDSCDLAILKFVLDRGGDVAALDNNGWTPLFRAVCQSARTEVVEELVARGSDLELRDHAGLPLACVARINRNRHGRSRDSVLRLVDSHYPHEKALANFSRLTKKIYNVHSLLKLI